jgi:hypothetical protein
MNKFVTCAVIALALALNAEAKDEEKEKWKEKDGPVYSVPDNGSTALLLGTAILAFGFARRRFATR